MSIKIISKQEGFSKKWERQLKLKEQFPEFELHCGGSAPHFKKIPKGCGGCLIQGINTLSIGLGAGLGFKNVCTANCKHCFDELTDNCSVSRTIKLPDNWKEIVDAYIAVGGPYNEYSIRHILQPSTPFGIISFTGYRSEPLLYIDAIEYIMKYFKTIFKDLDIQYKVYSNGRLLNKSIIDRLHAMGINELRINFAAHGFDSSIIREAEYACEKLDVVTCEVAAFPEYQDTILQNLKRLNDIGINHISICQLKFFDMNILEGCEACLGDNVIAYPASNKEIVVDDGGFVEKVIAETIKNKYNFSVLDCGALMCDQQDNRVCGIGKELNGLDINSLMALS